MTPWTSVGLSLFPGWSSPAERAVLEFIVVKSGQIYSGHVGLDTVFEGADPDALTIQRFRQLFGRNPHSRTHLREGESLDERARFLARRSEDDHYVIEYVDYASSDGHFRKYRFIFVGEEMLPYHLAIGTDWKVHHVSTDMANQPWMQQEEAAFLANPAAIFNAPHYQALRVVRERIGLDYFGIDCGLDPDGHLVVFEVNASMLVHDGNAEFPYKDSSVRVIKNAFDVMLRDRAGRSQHSRFADGPPP